MMGWDRWYDIVIRWVWMWTSCVVLVGGLRVVEADDQPAIQAIDAQGRPLELPEPPDELKRWIRLANVRFEFYDPAKSPRSFDGETKFDYRYDYRCRSDWKRVMIEGQPGIEVKVKYSAVTLEVSHVVLLPQAMSADPFSQRLMLHEFDHVKISGQPGLDKTLREMLVRRNAVIRQVLDSERDGFEGRPTDEQMKDIGRRLISERSNQVFEDFVELVKIRYRELDRVSRYGIQELSPTDRQRIVVDPVRTAADDR